MPDIKNAKPFPIQDMSFGLQDKTTQFLRKPGELTRARNIRYDTVGGLKPGVGYTQQGMPLTSTSSTSTSTSTTTTSTSTSTSSSTSTSTTTTTT